MSSELGFRPFFVRTEGFAMSAYLYLEITFGGFTSISDS